MPEKPDTTWPTARTPAKRERALIDSAIVGGRDKAADATRPMSSARKPSAAKEEGSIRYILRTGLPPGIDEAEEPASQRKRAPSKDCS